VVSACALASLRTEEISYAATGKILQKTAGLERIVTRLMIRRREDIFARHGDVQVRF
jgi:hypothetical protein